MIYSVMSGSVAVAATASSVSASITMPAVADGLLVVNTSGTDYVTAVWGTGAQTATLHGGLTLPPGGAALVAVGPLVNTVAAIGSAAGPNNVVFTPVKLLN